MDQFHPPVSHMRPGAFRRALCAIAVSAALLGSQHASADEIKLETDVQKLSYGIGQRFGEQLHNQLLQQGLEEADTDALVAGIRDILAGMSSRVSPEELDAAVKSLRAVKEAERAVASSRNKARGLAFMDVNKDAKDVVTLENGIQYRVLNAAEGEKPSAESEVKVHYIGRLLSGQEFDSSKSRGEPAQFSLGAVIKGWQEVVQLMPVGSTWEVWIPPQLAYGDRGAGRNIGPGETLHFDIELLDIIKK